MIASVHIADIGPHAVFRLRRQRSAIGKIPGLRNAEVTFASPLGESVRPEIEFGRVVFVATWEHEEALTSFLADHPVAERLSGGWHVRLQQRRIVGSWSQLPDLLNEEVSADDTEPVAVLTFGRLRLPSVVRFFKMAAPAEGLALANPALLAGTAMGRPSKVIGTFTLWRNTPAMRDYSVGRAGPGHREVLQANSARPFFHESVFVRFRPYGARGTWDGRDPLAAVVEEMPPAAPALPPVANA